MTPTETRTNHYARLTAYQNSREYADWAESVGWQRPTGDLPTIVGQRWEIDEDIYDEFLNMLPPIYTAGGFFICEETFGGYRAKFSREGDRYFCEYAQLPRRANALEPSP